MLAYVSVCSVIADAIVCEYICVCCGGRVCWCVFVAVWLFVCGYAWLIGYVCVCVCESLYVSVCRCV